MRARKWVRCSWLLVWLAVLSSTGFAAGQRNVLFLLVDDLRTELGCYGVDEIKTPNIDALAAAGVRFDRAYVQYPLCNPSRSSMLNGRYPTVTGVMDNTVWFGEKHPDFVSLPKYFKQQGYASLRAGKVFHGGIDDTDAWTRGSEKRRTETAEQRQNRQRQQPMQSDRIVELEGDGESHGDFRTAEATIRFLEEFKDQRFFMACGFTKPHSPPTAPKKLFERYDAAKMTLPVDFQPRPTVPEGWPMSSVPKRNGDLFIDRDASPEAAREMLRAYRASATFTDENVGRVMKQVDSLGLRKNTVIVFWGDHGYHLGEKGKWSKHGSLFEVGTRIPLIVIDPDASGNGKVCPRIVQSVDVYPTLCELCGLPVPQGLNGVSLAPLLKNPEAEWNRPAYSFAGNLKNTHRSVRTDRYRYTEYSGEGKGALLFDEQNDPHELKNLAADPKFSSVVKEMQELLAKLPTPQ
jgi:iduronate 2-sulfatase